LKRPDGAVWKEEDTDADGLLDVVEIRAANGAKTRMTGAEITDRKIPTIAIPYEKIRALVERAKAGSPAA
jgi:hypothetical protein